MLKNSWMRIGVATKHLITLDIIYKINIAKSNLHSWVRLGYRLGGRVPAAPQARGCR